MASRKISWTKIAIKQFEDAIAYIASDSTTHAGKVSEDLLKELQKTLKNSEFFPPDKYKKKNDGSYRSFEKHHYRIAYRVKENIILVLRVRHTGREPKMY